MPEQQKTQRQIEEDIAYVTRSIQTALELEKSKPADKLPTSHKEELAKLLERQHQLEEALKQYRQERN